MAPDQSRASADCPGQLGLLVLGGVLSLALALWDYTVLHGYRMEDWAAQPCYYAVHVTLDVLISWPVVALALMGAWVLARCAASGWRGWGEVMAVACCISYVLVFFMVPVNALRVLVHPALDERLAIPLHAIETGRVFAHSFGQGTRQHLIGESDGSEEAGVTMRLGWHGLRSALMGQCIVLPLLGVGLSVMPPWRRRVWRRL